MNIVLSMLAWMLVGCATSSTIGDPTADFADEEDNDLGWIDIADEMPVIYEPKAGEMFSFDATPDRLQKLPTEVAQHPELSYLALSRFMTKVQPFDSGILGKVDGASMFVSTPDRVGGRDRLYWTMVHVLSERFGCQMRHRWIWKDVTAFRCKDHRNVVFWLNTGQNWVQFHARQFDLEGEELLVQRRRAKRTGRLLTDYISDDQANQVIREPQITFR